MIHTANLLRRSYKCPLDLGFVGRKRLTLFCILQDISAGLNNTKKHIVTRDSRDFMGVAESIMIEDSGVIKGSADQRKRPGKTSYVYEFDDSESD